MVEVGAGPGTLARAVLAAVAAPTPIAPALRYVAVERSAAERASHPAEVDSWATWPEEPIVGVVLANELLDNLAFGLVAHHAGTWRTVEVGVDGDTLVEVPGAVVTDPDLPAAAPEGAWLPRQAAAAAFVRGCSTGWCGAGWWCSTTRPPTPSCWRGPWTDWVRTYRDHERGGPPLDEPGTQDVTCEVALDALRAGPAAAAIGTQAEFLVEHGIDELVAEGRRIWHEGAATGGLAALRARSRVREADALLDPGGLGGFTVVRWVR